MVKQAMSEPAAACARAVAFWLTATSIALAAGALIGTRTLIGGFGGAGLVPLGGQGGWYSPLDGLLWSRAAASRFPLDVAKAWGTGALASVGVLALAVLIRRTLFVHRVASDSHGSARWAERDDIVEADLLDRPTTARSLIVGGWLPPGVPRTAPPEYLVHTGPESIWAFAPSRSGKTSGLVVPNLFSYESSAFAVDLRGDLWDTTAGFRRDVLGQRVLFHDPGSANEGGACFNPLDEIDVTLPTAVRDVQMMLEFLIPSAEKKHAHSHFDDSARSLAVGIFLYEMTLSRFGKRPPTTIAGVLSEITRPGRPIRDYLKTLSAFEQVGLEDVSRVVRETATEMLERDEREFSGVKSSLTTPLSKFRDPILARATSRSDFRLLDLVHHRTPVTLYLTIRPADRKRLKHYAALIVSLVCQKLTDTLTRELKTRRELLLLLDEFLSLPPLPVVQEAMNELAGYGVKAFIVVQDYEGLLGHYGENEMFSSNAKILVAYTPSKPKTAKFLSELIGTSTARQETESSQHKPLSALPTSESEAEGYHSRPLMTPDEVMRLGVARVDEHYRMTVPGEALVFARGSFPIRGVMTPWFMDPEFVARAEYGAPAKSDRLGRPVLQVPQSAEALAHA